MCARPVLRFAIALAVLFGCGLPRASAFGDAPKPAKKDSPKFLKPRAATLTASVEPAQAHPGDTITFRVEAKLEPNWHIYAYSKAPNNGGPIQTSFDFFDPDGLKPTGDWQPSRDPIIKKEPLFQEVPFVSFYEDEVTWSIKLKVPDDAAAGKRTLRCQAGYMVCDPNSCSQPGKWTLNDVEVTIAAGNPAATAPAVSATKPAPTAAPDSKKPAVVATAPPKSDVAALKVEPPASVASVTGEVPASATESPAKARSEAEEKASQGLMAFLLFSAFGGLIALAMPCVWPMVPVTVNFFVKQGQSNGGKGATKLAVVYALSIVAIFTAVGVGFSYFLSAAFLQNLANNGWLNLTVAGIFLLFGLSLLGLFELTLPSFLANASAAGESRGGLVGVMFMALTLTITSFTCTFPVVGGLLVMAAGGSFFYPIVGLATFATVLAAPFFLLALAPGLLAKMPKSGDWMNTVKVVGGLVEIAAAFKFINTAEIGLGAVPENAWFDAQVVLSIWVVLAAVCGFYLLGFFRTDHDYDEPKVGPGRILSGSMFLVLALYLAPALFGNPPHSMIWNRLVVGLLPPDSGELSRGVALARAGSAEEEVKSTSTDPNVAERQQRSFHGVAWGFSLEAAQERARAENKPILIDFTGVNCANCRLMEASVLPRPDVVGLLREFVTVQLFTDFVPLPSITQDQREELALKNQQRLLKLANDNTNPFYVVINADGTLLGRKGGYVEPPVFLAFLKSTLAKTPTAAKVTSNDVQLESVRSFQTRVGATH